jgi:hypothetical protein
LLRMTPTRTFNAVLVWLRASERISVTALGIWNYVPFPIQFVIKPA